MTLSGKYHNDTTWKNLNDLLEDFQLIEKKKKESYYNVASVFDIETSSFYIGEEKNACMYCWVFGINGKCIRGRTWDEFLEVINTLINRYDLSKEKRFIIYVHNLAYEFQWIRKLFKWEKIFSIEQRRPLYAITTSGIEFRCSYMLSGYSLESVGNNLTKYKINKMVGDLDYDLIRHSTTPLSDKEWGYVMNDGLVVMSYIQEEIERMGDITKLPLTKTGYVRLLCRDNCLKGANKYNYSKMISRLTLTLNEYEELKRVYSGGFTHANNKYVNKIMNNVASFDFTSSYPTVMISEKYPMTKPRKIEIKSKEQFLKLLDTYCCMFDIQFNDLKSIVDFEHYISRSKCSFIDGYVLDNGRVVKAKILRTALTELDFKIIEKMYTWKSMKICNFYVMEKAYLPKELINVILKLYGNKTTLKGVEDKVVEYLVSKGMLNSIYGMCVTDICRDEFIYDNDWSTIQCDKDALLNEYNYSKTRFLYYAWGVWVTAYARYNLFSGILECKDDYIYSDTDSIKILNYKEHDDYFNKYNSDIIRKLSLCLRHYNIPINKVKPKTIKGVEKPLGVWDFEGVYESFKTLGAKRYMYVQDNDCHITISGVKKKNGIEYLKHKYKTNENILKHFTNGLLFPAEYSVGRGKDKQIKNATGKLTHIYIDDERKGKVIDYLGNENTFHELSSVFMEKASYDLSLEEDFWEFICGFDLTPHYIK